LDLDLRFFRVFLLFFAFLVFLPPSFRFPSLGAVFGRAIERFDEEPITVRGVSSFKFKVFKEGNIVLFDIIGDRLIGNGNRDVKSSEIEGNLTIFDFEDFFEDFLLIIYYTLIIFSKLSRC